MACRPQYRGHRIGAIPTTRCNSVAPTFSAESRKAYPILRAVLSQLALGQTSKHPLTVGRKSGRWLDPAARDRRGALGRAPVGIDLGVQLRDLGFQGADALTQLIGFVLRLLAHRIVLQA